MSADNWAICPRCLDKAKSAHDAKLSEVENAYGVVPPQEWLTAREAATVPIDEEKLRTFREDYEIGLDVEGASIYVAYEGYCERCGLHAKFKRQEPLEVQA